MEEWRFDTPGSLSLSGVRRLRIRVVAGEVDVVGREADDEDGGVELEISELDGPLVVHQDGEIATVEHERPSLGDWFDWLGFRQPRAVVSVAVSSECSLEVGVVSAGATIAGMAAPTTLRSVSGDVTLADIDADVRARTVSGDLETWGHRGSLEFKTVSGDLTVVDGASPRVFAETVSGEVTLDQGEQADGHLELVSVSGDLTLRLPDDASLEVELRTISGEVESAFDGVVRREKLGQTTLSGRVGGGAGALRAKTVSGDVTLLRRSAS